MIHKEKRIVTFIVFCFGLFPQNPLDRFFVAPKVFFTRCRELTQNFMLLMLYELSLIRVQQGVHDGSVLSLSLDYVDDVEFAINFLLGTSVEF